MKQKDKVVFVCCECGYESAKWNGICPSCGQGNTMNEEVALGRNHVSNQKNNFLFKSKERPIAMKDVDITAETRYSTGFKELDRVFGGGIVRGSFVLLGGAPGVGKSTLLLQMCNFADDNIKILYISAEESKKQIKLRASRLGATNSQVLIMAETDIDVIISQAIKIRPNILIIDSIQTIRCMDSTSLPGSVSQVKECANLLLGLSKTEDISVLAVGHVNKDGAIAGPKVLEHMVDAVIYFEGEKNTPYKIIRSAKNRYGSTNEIGVFQMTNAGLEEVENPSYMLLSGRAEKESGTSVTCAMEGTRPILIEVQSLVTNSGFGNPRRMATGFDYNRLALILAVLEKRAGYFFSNLDVYVNIVGGIKLDEPTADLSVAISLISSLKNRPINEGVVVFGEIGLTGEIRSVQNAHLRIAEAERLGFKHCIVPYNNFVVMEKSLNSKIKITGVKNIKEAFEVGAF